MKSSEDAIGPAMRPLDGARNSDFELVANTVKLAHSEAIALPENDGAIIQDAQLQPVKPRGKIRSAAVLAGLFVRDPLGS